MARKTLKILLFLFLVSLFIIPPVYAVTTDINVKTSSYHRLYLSVLKSGEPLTYIQKGKYQDTKYLGELNYSITTTDSKIDLILTLGTDNGTQVLGQRFYDIETDKPILINFKPGNVNLTYGNLAADEPIITADNSTSSTNSTNASNEADQNSTENTTIPPIAEPAINITNKTSFFKSNFSITGYATQFYKNNSKTFLYVLIVIGIIVGILIIIFIVKKIPGRSTDHYTIRPHKPLESVSSSNPSLVQAEKKLKEAQQEIEFIKRKNESIREAEIRLHEDSIRLERLKRGY